MSVEKQVDQRSWCEIQDELAENSGLAISLIEKDGLSSVCESNNNSICRAMLSSKEFSPKCSKFCGEAYSHTVKAQKPLKYKCFAGLECITVPITAGAEKKLVAITGRAFTKTDDYKKATERSIRGDWKSLPPIDLFENALLTPSIKNIGKLGKKLADVAKVEREALTDIKAESKKKEEVESAALIKSKPSRVNKTNKKPLERLVEKINADSAETSRLAKEISQRKNEQTREFAEWRAFFNSMLGMKYSDASLTVLKFISQKYKLSSLAWLENRNNRFKKTNALGSLKRQKINISLSPADPRFKALFAAEDSIQLEIRSGSEKNAGLARFFPVFVGDEAKSGLVVGEGANDPDLVQSLSRFCRMIASEMEILRLREEISRRSWLDLTLQKFNESLKMIETQDFWQTLIQDVGGLLRSERGSLLVYDEGDEKLKVMAAIGPKADFIRKTPKNIGQRISQTVFGSGKPLVVPNIHKIGITPAPPTWKYRSDSFICYPLTIGERKIGVLNMADKTDGSNYDNFDLQLLNSVGSQIAIAIDHANLKHIAGEFEQLSVTDSLTGLLNRRYLEERLTEEIKRSNRHGYQMSFMMIDVDNFKEYNDTYSHPEGDKALRLVGKALRESLRGADVAARYGGEEFSILLPQTNSEEARIIAERIREKIKNTKFPNRSVTVSIGISSISFDVSNAEDIISAADKALYQAKRNGRDNVRVYVNQIKQHMMR